MDCIFCKIISKNVPNYNVYEDDAVLAFLDIHPHAKGHTVVVPKRHVATAFDLTDDELTALARGVKCALERIKTVLSPAGFNTGWNDGAVAGQVVPHTHIHILPRWQGDGGTSMHGIINHPGEISVAEIAKLF